MKTEFVLTAVFSLALLPLLNASEFTLDAGGGQTQTWTVDAYGTLTCVGIDCNGINVTTTAGSTNMVGTIGSWTVNMTGTTKPSLPSIVAPNKLMELTGTVATITSGTLIMSFTETG